MVLPPGGLPAAGAQQSNDANLSALTFATSTDGSMFDGSLSFSYDFQAGTTFYESVVPRAVTHVKLTATTRNNGASVKAGVSGTTLSALASGTQSDAIELGAAGTATIISIKVTAEDGVTTLTYTVQITRRDYRALLSSTGDSPLVGSEIRYLFRLDEPPSHSVTVTLGTSDSGIATVSPASLTLTSTAHSAVVKVTGVGAGIATISHTLASTDTNYNNLTAPSFEATVARTETAWVAELTVDDDPDEGTNAHGFHGGDGAFINNVGLFGALSDASFTAACTAITVQSLRWGQGQDSDKSLYLDLDFDFEGPGWAFLLDDDWFWFEGDLDEAAFEANGVVGWYDAYDSDDNEFDRGDPPALESTVAVKLLRPVVSDAALAAPTALSPVAGDGQLALSWTAPAMGTVSCYEVQYRHDGAGNDLADDASEGWFDSGYTGSTAAHTLSGLTNAQAYDVRVRAVSADGTSPWVSGTGTPTSGVSTPQITLASSASNDTVTESDADQTVTLTVSVPSNVTSDTMVTLTRKNTSTATVNADYTLAGSVTITSGTKSASATLTIKGDQLDEGASETLVLEASATGYTTSSELSLTITDDDTAGVTVSRTALSVAAGGSATYTLVLDSEPTATVTVTPSSGATSKATVSGALMFTSSDWNTPKEVTVNGVAAGSATVSHAVSSSDGKYPSSLSVEQVAVKVNLLVTNFGQTEDSWTATTSNRVRFQGFTTGANTGGYTLEAIKTATNAGASASQRNSIRAELWSSSGGSPGAKLADLEVPTGAISAGDVSFEAPSDTPLAPSTGYFLVLYTTGTHNLNLPLQASGAEDATSASGWAIGNNSGFVSGRNTPGSSPSWALSSRGPLKLEVTGAAADAPGAPTSLVATAGVSQLGLTWTAPASGTVVGYDVHYTSAPTSGNGAVTNGAAVQTGASPDPDDGWVDAGHTGTATSATITGLAAKSHRVRVRAVYAVGSAWVHTTGTPTAPALPQITLAATDSGNNPVTSVTETDADQTVTVTVSVPSNVTSDTTVTLTRVSTSTATVNADYTLAGSVTITSGTKSASATLTIKGDQLDEDDETLVLEASASGYTKSAALSLTITDDDTAGVTVRESSTVATAVTARSVQVGAEVTYALVLDSQPTADVTVTPTSSDTAKARVSPATLTFSATNWNTPQTVTVTGVAAAAASEGVKVTHAVTASSDTKYNKSPALSIGEVALTVTAAATPTITLSSSASGDEVTETDADQTVTVTAELSAAAGSQGVSVGLARNSSSTASTADFTLSPATISISSGQTRGTATLTVKGDQLVEADETLVLDATATDHTAGSLTVTIKDDDTAAAPADLAASGNAQLGLSWTAPSGVLSGYDVHYTSAPTMGAGLVTNIADVQSGVNPSAADGWVDAAHSGTGASHTITGLVNGRAYRVRVRAKSAAGPGAWAHATGTPAVPALPQITLTSSDADGTVAESGSTSDRTLTLTATLPSAATSAVTVTVARKSGSATSGDFSLTGSPISIAVNARTGTATLVIADDDIDEGASETLVLKATATGYAEGTLSLTITDDDTAGVTVRESATSSTAVTARTVEVGETVTYGVVLNSKPTANVVVTPSSSDATKASVSGALTFKPSNWDTVQTVTVTGVATGTPKAQISHSVASTDAKYPSSLSVADVEVTVNASTKTFEITSAVTAAEGASASLTVTLGRAAPMGGIAFTVAYSYPDSTATAADLQGTPPASVTVSATMTTASLSVPIKQDALLDGSETVTVTITPKAGVTGWAKKGEGKDTATITITDDEQTGAKIAFGNSAAATAAHTDSAAENKTSPATVSVPVTISALPQTSTTFTITASGTATKGTDYTIPASVTFAQNAQDTATTKNVVITLSNDALVEFDETVELQIAAADVTPDDLGDLYVRHASGSKATVTITDDEAAGAKVAFGSSAAATAEYKPAATAENVGGGVLSVPVTVSALPGKSTTFAVEVVGAGTTATEYVDAQNPGDFRIETKSVTFGTTGSRTKNVSIAIRNDAWVERDQTIKLRLTAARASSHMDYDVGDLYARDAAGDPATDTDGAGSEAVLTIADDEADAAKIAFHATDAASTAKLLVSVEEEVSGGTVTVPVRISALPESSTTFTVEVLTAGTAAEYVDAQNPGDFRIASKSVTFEPGDASTAQNVSIAIENDALVEDDQTIELKIAAADATPDDLGDLYVRHASGSLAQVTIGDDEADVAKIVFGTDLTATSRLEPTGAEGDGTLSVPVRISHLPESSTVFTVEVLNTGTARSTPGPNNPTGNPADYTIATATVEFDATPNGFTKNLVISIADDNVEEDDETIDLRIEAADATPDLGDYYTRVSGASTAQVTLTSDDQVSSVVLSLPSGWATRGAGSSAWYPVREGTAVTVTATANIPVGPGGWSVAVSNPVIDLPPWGGMLGVVSNGCRSSGQWPAFACPNDYMLPTTFTIRKGQTQATATVTLRSDTRDEPNPERLGLAAKATRGDRSVTAATLALRIEENASGIIVEPASAELIPGEATTYAVALSGATAPTGNVTVTPTSGDTDKATVSCAVDPCVLTFTGGSTGNWETPQTVTVTAAAAAAAGTVEISHATASADTAWNQLTGLAGFSAKVNAAANTYRIAPAARADEGGTAELEITLGALAPTGGLSFTVDRSRAHDLEYLDGNVRMRDPEAGLADPAADLASPPATVTVMQGERTVTLSDPIADDDLAEGDEHYYVVISTATAGWARETGEGATGSRTCAQDGACARVEIADNDTTGLAIGFGDTATATAAHTASAGEGSGTISVPVTVSALPAAQVAFDIEVLTSSTATDGTDYTIATKSVTFGPTDTDTTKDLAIAVTDDSDAEGDETIRLRIEAADATPDDLGDSYVRHPNGSQAAITITDDDGAVDVDPTALTVADGGTATYTIVLRGARPANAVTVTPTSGDTAKAAVACAGTPPCALSFTTANWNIPQTVTVTGTDTTTSPVAVSHTVGGTDPAYPSSLTVSDVRVTVTALPTVTITAPSTVTEGQRIDITVTISRAPAANTAIPITVTARTPDPAETGDWTAPATITIPAGQTTATGRLTANQDPDTTDENIRIAIDTATLPQALAAGTPNHADVTIEDNDTPQTPRTPVGPPPPPGGGGPIGGGSGSGDDKQAGETERLWGQDRYATSLEVAREVAAAADGKLTTVVLAGGHSWTDALSAGSLAGALDAALLLTAPDGLPAGTIEWIKSLGVTEIIAVGSTEHITDTALAALADIDADIERITDPSPQAASVAVARRVGRPETLGPLLGRTVIVASSAVFADALAAGPLAAKGPHPILLTDKDELHPHTAAYLADHADHVVIMGGTAAITTDVEEQIRAIAQANRAGDRPMAITRLGGTDRYDTSVKLARWLASPALQGRVCFTTDTVGLATGANPADAAASAPLLARRCAPLVLTHPDRLPPIVASYLRRAGELLVFGGTKAINQTALDDWTR